MISISRQVIADRVAAAAALFRQINPELPVVPANLVQAADAHGLPIGPEPDHLVGRTIFIAAFCDDANPPALQAGIDGICRLFGIGEAAPAVA